MANQISEIEFERLIFENQFLIIKVCNIYCKSQADKDDLFQDITINLWKGLASFQGNSKLSTWIYRVSLNTAISRSQKSKRNPLFYTEDISETKTDKYESEEDNDYQIKALYAGIDKLKPLDKAIVLLYLEERSYDEIADIMGISTKNVSVKLVRLKRKLEKMLKPLITIDV